MKFFTPSFLLLVCFVFGGIMFKSMATTRCGTLMPDDTIFVLTGDERRIPFAMDLLKKYPDIDLYIIGAGADASAKTKRRINIEASSKSTYQNARAIREIATRTGLDRIVLITTEDHMLRARYLVRTEMPTVEIVECPVVLAGMRPSKRLERWAVEYIKYIATMIGIKEG